MKIGKTLQELAKEVERQAKSKRDYIVQSSSLEMLPSLQLRVKNNGGFQAPLKSIAHDQLAAYLDIPRSYYDRMMHDSPELLAKNINNWLPKMENEKRMLRVLDEHIRAIPSASYRRIDNYDLLNAVLPELNRANMMLLSCEITDRRLYLKAVSQSITKDIPCNRMLGDGSHIGFDTLSPGITISNSEVCFGQMSVETSIYTHGCTNMALVGNVLKRRHTGKKQDIFDGADISELLSNETKALTDQALFAQVKDVVVGALNELNLEEMAGKLAALQEKKIEKPVIEFIELTSKHFGFNEGEKQSVLTHLIQGGDLSQYGLFNAVTRTAEDTKDYDRATDFERFGGAIIELTGKEWSQFASA